MYALYMLFIFKPSKTRIFRCPHKKRQATDKIVIFQKFTYNNTISIDFRRMYSFLQFSKRGLAVATRRPV